jgi:hypothetical protein
MTIVIVLKQLQNRFVLNFKGVGRAKTNKPIVYITKNSTRKNTVDALAKLYILNTPVVVRANKLKLMEIGHGDGVLKWKLRNAL